MAVATDGGVLVERDAELARLHESFEAAVGGHGRLVLVAGEAGIGKTSLVRRFCRELPGTFVFQADEDACRPKSPESGAAFGFWHPDLVTLHVWAWYPNPDGVYSGTNPLMRPFNEG